MGRGRHAAASSSSSSSSSRALKAAGLGASFVLAGAAFGAGDVLQLTKLAVDDASDAATRAPATHQLAARLPPRCFRATGARTLARAQREASQRSGRRRPQAVEAALFLAKVPEQFTGGQEEGGQGSASSTWTSVAISQALEQAQAALNLLLVLVWGLPMEVRPVLRVTDVAAATQRT